jgi:hypothetical protein
VEPNALLSADRVAVRRRRFLWAAPLVWSLVLVGAHRWPGDEYGWFAAASLPAWPAWYLLHRVVNGMTGLPWAIACGLPVMVLLGWWMDRVRVRVGPVAVGWLVLAATLAVPVVASDPTIRAAIAKNGSLWAYAFGALGFMAPVACFLSALRGTVRSRLGVDP